MVPTMSLSKAVLNYRKQIVTQWMKLLLGQLPRSETEDVWKLTGRNRAMGGPPTSHSRRHAQG